MKNETAHQIKRTAMKPRKTPMRRTRFENARPGALVVAAAATTEARRAGPEYRYGAPQVAALFKPAPKHEYVRSEALMKAYRMIPCQMCGARDGTVCGAHSNWHPHHKGGAVKADDNCCASLCFTCHAELDQGKRFTIDEKRERWWRAHVSTLVLLAKLSLWPKDVPYPNINDNPWS